MHAVNRAKVLVRVLIAFLRPNGQLGVVGVSGGAPNPLGRLRGRSIDWQPLPPGRGHGCLDAPGSAVVAKSTDAVVTQDGMGAPFQVSPPVAFMGCLLATGRERLLVRYDFQSEDMESGAAGAVTAGDYASLATFQTDIHYGGSSNTLAVYDLRTRNPVTRLGGEMVQC